MTTENSGSATAPPAPVAETHEDASLFVIRDEVMAAIDEYERLWDENASCRPGVDREAANAADIRAKSLAYGLIKMGATTTEGVRAKVEIVERIERLDRTIDSVWWHQQDGEWLDRLKFDLEQVEAVNKHDASRNEAWGEPTLLGLYEDAQKAERATTETEKDEVPAEIMERLDEAEEAFANAPPANLADAVLKLRRVHGLHQKTDTLDELDGAHVGAVLAYLENILGFGRLRQLTTATDHINALVDRSPLAEGEPTIADMFARVLEIVERMDTGGAPSDEVDRLSTEWAELDRRILDGPARSRADAMAKLGRVLLLIETNPDIVDQIVGRAVTTAIRYLESEGRAA